MCSLGVECDIATLPTKLGRLIETCLNRTHGEVPAGEKV